MDQNGNTTMATVTVSPATDKIDNTADGRKITRTDDWEIVETQTTSNVKDDWVVDDEQLSDGILLNMHQCISSRCKLHLKNLLTCSTLSVTSLESLRSLYLQDTYWHFVVTCLQNLSFP